MRSAKASKYTPESCGVDAVTVPAAQVGYLHVTVPAAGWISACIKRRAKQAAVVVEGAW